MKWSNSKYQTLRQCSRKYFFQYVLPDHHFTYPIRRKAFELSKTQNLRMWMGSIVDWAMSNLIIPVYKLKRSPDFSKIADEAIETAKRQFQFSEQKLYREKGNTKSKIGSDYLVLDIHDLNLSYREEKVSQVYADVREIIERIPEYPSPEEGKSMNQYLLESSFLQPNEQWWRYQFEDITLNPQIDLIRYKGKKITVIDWKVSASQTGDYGNQLTIAGIVTFNNKRKLNAEKGWTPPNLDDIELFEINLYNGYVKQHPFNRERTAAVLDKIYINGSDTEQLFGEMKWNEIDIESLEITDKKETCAMCKFQPLCVHLIQNNYQYDESKFNQLVPSGELA